MAVLEIKLGRRVLRVPLPDRWSGEVRVHLHDGEVIGRQQVLTPTAHVCGDCGSFNVLSGETLESLQRPLLGLEEYAKPRRSR